MGGEQKDTSYTECQKGILDLEKKYFNRILEIVRSVEFSKDLLKIESYIKDNYSLLNDRWKLKNKLKVPVERLLRYHIYKNMSEIESVYPSALSSDVAFYTKDAVINIDAKTVDLVGNKVDINQLQFDNNQSSFKNKELDSDGEYRGVKIEAFLPEVDTTGLPILTFFLKVVYFDDGSRFEINRNLEGSMIFSCLPNGKLSDLFDNNIISNLKTYNYFTEKDDEKYEPMYLGKHNDLKDILKTELFYSIAEEIIEKKYGGLEGWRRIKGRTKLGFYTPQIKNIKYEEQGVAWFPVKKGKPAKQWLMAVQNGNTARVPYNILEKRLDSNKEKWSGHEIIKIKENI